MYICVYFQIRKYSQHSLYNVSFMYVSRANCLVSLPWEDYFSHSPLSVKSRSFPLSYLYFDSVPRIQCLDSAPRNLNCFLSSLLLSKVTIQSPILLIPTDKTEIRGLPAEALVDGGPCSFPLFDSRVGTVFHSCKCLSIQGTAGCMPERGTVSYDYRCLSTRYARLYAGEIGAYDLFTLVFFIRTKTGFEQKIVYNPVFWMLQSNVPSCLISTPIILGLCKPSDRTGMRRGSVPRCITLTVSHRSLEL